MSGRYGQNRLRGHGARTGGTDGLIPKHGGYRRLKSFQIAQLVYDVTVRFCGTTVSEADTGATEQMVKLVN